MQNVVMNDGAGCKTTLACLLVQFVKTMPTSAASISSQLKALYFSKIEIDSALLGRKLIAIE
jgi:hypothetical protein